MGCTIGTPGGRSERIPLRADGDPAAALKGAIHRPKVEHRKPLARDQIPAFLKALDSCGGHRTTLRLILLAFVRTAELRGAAWAEVDLLRSRMAHPWVTDEDARRASRALVRPSPCAAGGTAYAYAWPAVAVPKLPHPQNPHVGNNIESCARTHGVQPQGRHRIVSARIPGYGVDDPE
jgi:hypothetical protein